MTKVLTIGHSNHSIGRFLDLLTGAGITAIADVRTTPRSRWTPHFDAAPLKTALAAHGIAYAPLGKELGGRPSSPELYCDGHADYEAMASTPGVREGIARVLMGAQTHLIALMCSEKEPMDCHRCLMVARELAKRGVQIGHVHGDGRIETQTEFEERLLNDAKLHPSMLDDRDVLLIEAYRKRTARIAYRR